MLLLFFLLFVSWFLILIDYWSIRKLLASHHTLNLMPHFPSLTILGSRQHQRSSVYWLCQNVWLCGSQSTVEYSERDGNTSHLTCLLRNLYAGQEARVRTKSHNQEHHSPSPHKKPQAPTHLWGSRCALSVWSNHSCARFMLKCAETGKHPPSNERVKFRGPHIICSYTQLCPILTTPWTVAHQTPPSMGFSRQGYWSGLPFPSPWSPLEWTGWISLQSKGLSRVFSNTAVQRHQFLGAQLSSQSNSHIHTWPVEKP